MVLNEKENKIMIRFKPIFSVAAFVVFAVCGALAAPQPAFAGGGGDGRDCTAGCVIYTCNNGNCTVWYCSGETGCMIVGSFRRNRSQSNIVMGDAKHDSSRFVDGIDYVKLCPAGEKCALYELSSDRATLLGEFDNMRNIIQARKTQLANDQH